MIFYAVATSNLPLKISERLLFHPHQESSAEDIGRAGTGTRTPGQMIELKVLVVTLVGLILDGDHFLFQALSLSA